MKNARVTLVVLIVIAIIDFAVGSALNSIFFRTNSGESSGGLINNTLRQDPDILILGSSRARHHVMPSVLEEKLGQKAYNAGLDGNDFLYAFMLMDLWKEKHHAPKLLLLQVDPSSFRYNRQELDRASIFSPYYYKNDIVREILSMRGRFESLKYLSYSYRFNGKVFPMVRNFTHPTEVKDGFVGLDGSLTEADMISLSKATNAPDAGPSWDKKVGYLNCLIDYCNTNKTRLILFHSPLLCQSTNEMSVWNRQLSELKLDEKGVVFLDFSQGAYEFCRRPELFRDQCHLNAKGAKLFSLALADAIAPYISPTFDTGQLFFGDPSKSFDF